MLYYNIGGSMNNNLKRVKVLGPEKAPFEAYLVEESDKKFIVANKKGNVEMHFPKKDYTYIVVEDK
tara:strand:+ start:862 stop:1059 length:198 start_codon:yes stop_codon:yes gene_type:complete